MATLDRRVTALEQIADANDPYMIEARRIAAEFGQPLAEVLAGAEEEARKVAAMRARGMTEREILEATAADIGCTVTELEAECEHLDAH